MNITSTDIRRTAVHEAAHAAVAVHLGLPINQVALTPRNPGRRGYVELSGLEDDDADRFGLAAARAQAVVALSAAPAERKAGFRAEGHDRRDEQAARDLLQSDVIFGDADVVGPAEVQRETSRLLAEARSLAESLVADQQVWRGITRLAAELERAGTVDGKRARKVVLGNSMSALVEPLVRFRRARGEQLPPLELENWSEFRVRPGRG